MSLKNALTIFLIISLFLPLSVSCGKDTYSHGYSAGTLFVFEVKSTMGKKHGEGQLLLGSTSSTARRDRFTINPWYFSAEENMCEELEALAGQKVVIEYSVRPWPDCRMMHTDYIVQSVYLISTELPGMQEIGERSEGANDDRPHFGRIVQAGPRDESARDWQIMFQEGYGGNSFWDILITDRMIYDAAVEFLKHQTPISIESKRRSFVNLLTDNSPFQVLTYIKADQKL